VALICCLSACFALGYFTVKKRLFFFVLSDLFDLKKADLSKAVTSACSDVKFTF
jgi:hypothetical protein